MPPTKTPRSAQRAAIQAALAVLAERWPGCFKLDPQRRRPLAVGIRAEIEQQLPDCDPRLLQKALGFYVASMAYQRALIVPGAVRVALDGGASGTVTAEQAKKAILSVAALAGRQGSRNAAKTPAAAAMKATAVSQARTVQVPKSPEASVTERPRLGLGDLREAGRRRAADLAKGKGSAIDRRSP
jgi:sRNA-binding protein